ncbi:caspase-14-like [Anopheles albimanus]|uniref:caspase-14-like n=1 Tax=Anopheles albimanus TaxID=7167 RepID=UPI00163FC685|nr:caspase-14-like [Anopheles albimanus]
MGACGSKPKKKKSTSESPSEDRLKRDAIPRKSSISMGNGFQQISTSVTRTSVQNNRVVSSQTIQSFSKSGSSPLMQPSLTHNFVQQEAISSGFSSGQSPTLQTKNRPSYSPVYKSLVTSSAKPSIINSGTKVGAAKYDLSKKAYVLVFHHDKFKNVKQNREGSQKDMEKVKSFFRNYRVDWLNVNENKTAAEVRIIMDRISRQNFSDYSCFITIIMSHGLLNDRIAARDDETYCFEEDVVEKCTSNRTLDGKPKVFIVQACRGDATMATDSQKTQSKKSDVLTFQSTYKGFFSYRDTQKGTFFIQHFFNLLEQHRNEDICHINKQLNQVFERERISQNPTMTTTLKRDLIFGDLRKP